MSWTWQGRQLATAEKGGTTLSYTYDSEGIRTSKTVGSTTTKYLLNGTQILAQTTNGKTLSFFYDQQGNRVAMADGSNKFYYYIYNLQGDVIALADASIGKLAVTYTYDAWGKVLSVNDTTANSVGTLNPFRYRSYYYDTETSLYYLQSRYYDPDTGRFINADAYATTDAGGVLSSNMFAYCENNPILRSDPTGEWVHILVGGVLGGISALVDGIGEDKKGGALIRAVAFGTISGAVSAACPTAGRIVDLALTGIDAVWSAAEEDAGALTKNVVAGAGSVGFSALSNLKEDYLTTKNFSTDLSTISEAKAKLRPGNHPKVKKDARKVINITAKNMRKKALRAGASNGAMSTLKFGFSKLLKLIF